MPFILPIITVAPVRRAPVLPAETKAFASPFLTRLSPTTIEESFFLLIAVVGTSSVLITSEAFTISIFSFGKLYFSSSFFIISSMPTRITLLPNSFTASTAPFTTSYGALSPPIASTAILIFSILITFVK